MKATWDESSSEESDDEELEQTNFLALTARDYTNGSGSEDELEAESERSHGSASVSEGSNPFVSKNRLYSLINYLMHKVAKSKIRIKTLLKEVTLLKETPNNESLTDQVQTGTSTQVQKLEEENSNMKSQVKDLKTTIE